MEILLDALGGLMQRGGWVMWPLAASLVVVLLVSFNKLIQWGLFALHCWRGKASWKHFLQTFSAEAPQPYHGPSPYGDIYNAAREQTEFPPAEALTIEAQKSLRRLERGLGVLDTIVTLAPMLGILGTVTGIIASFNLLGASGNEDPVGVAAGIAEALLTTASGLVISMVALLPLNAGRAHHTTLALQMEEALTPLEKKLTSVPALTPTGDAH